jgi:hypothetical protein
MKSGIPFLEKSHSRIFPLLSVFLVTSDQYFFHICADKKKRKKNDAVVLEQLHQSVTVQ